jgi:hypothetical protein
MQMTNVDPAAQASSESLPPHAAYAPSNVLFLTEGFRALFDFGLLVGSTPILAALPTGDRHPVMVLPGLMGSDPSTLVLRRILRRLGYPTHRWRQGVNVGPTREILDGMRHRLKLLADQHAQPVSLIGWSLGGIFARRIAREQPEAVRQVITLGSPFGLTDKRQSRANELYELNADRHAERWELPIPSEQEPLTVPSTAIYSRLDGIVAWGTSLGQSGPIAENIEVCASHTGMAVHPAVIWAIADRLAQPAGAWKPFRPPFYLRGAFPRPASASARD